MPEMISAKVAFMIVGPGVIMRYFLSPVRVVAQQKWLVRRSVLSLLALCIVLTAGAQRIMPAAECMADYLPLLEGKRVALLINQTSRVGNLLLADTLKKRGVKLVRIFVPEHGFRGSADAGAHVANTRDSATGLPIVSLYGEQKKPRPDQMADFDILIYDLQDVGVRFYTYISTLQYVMEACAENGRRLMVLDRPNPNGFYVAGPILDTQLRSFVGMQPVPIVYGMTAGEYAKMLQGERWTKGTDKLSLTVIPCRNYNHKSHYELPVPPSPNLRTAEAIRLYPSLCLFEGTVISVGRGTDQPFEQWGHPSLKGAFSYAFTPHPTVGAAKPPYDGTTCYGMKVSDDEANRSTFTLAYLMSAYKAFPDKRTFFNSFFEKLAGTKLLRKQIEDGMDAEAIANTWKPDLTRFKKIRKKYLLYKDFE